LLSTHIVEDVATLCPKFAVIRKGKLVAMTTPKNARENLKGHIFEGVVEQPELENLRNEYHVTQAMVYEGANKVRIYLEQGSPPVGFESVPPTLEDAYFISMKNESNGAIATGLENVAGGVL
jgi:ABC-type multidrug transport system ATPase subunit